MEQFTHQAIGHAVNKEHLLGAPVAGTLGRQLTHCTQRRRSSSTVSIATSLTPAMLHCTNAALTRQ